MTNQQTAGIANPPSNLQIIGSWAFLGGLLLAAAGASFAPWVTRPPAALVLTAPDLAEFVKFLPEVREGTLKVSRLMFLSPLFVTALTLPLSVAVSRLDYPRWIRWAVLITVIPLSLTLLPPVWSPDVLMSTEFRPQTIACALCLSLVVLNHWLGRTPFRLVLSLSVLLSLAAPALALWQFLVIRGAVARAYASPIAPGWGTWTTLAGFGVVILGALLTSWGPRAVLGS